MWHSVFTSCRILHFYKKNQRITGSLNKNILAGGKSEIIMNGLRSIKFEYTLLGDAANRKSRVNFSVDTEGALSCDPHEAQHVTWADHTAASRMHNMNSPRFDF